MSLLNSYICPECSKLFSFFIRPSLVINRGLLAPYLKCPHCGQISRPKIEIFIALWVWPLTLILFVIWIHTLRTFFDYKLTILYVLWVILSLIPFIIGLRRGFKLVKVEKENGRPSSLYKWILPLFGLILFSFFWGYYTHNWHNVFIGNVVGFIVWGFYCHFSNKFRKIK